MVRPTSPEAITAPLKTRSATGCVCLDTMTAAVAATIESSTYRCQGRNPVSVAGAGGGELVEVLELMIESRFEGGVACRRRRLAGRTLRTTRPAHRRAADHQDAAQPRRIREEPGQAIEAAVDRLRQHFLATVFVDEMLDDLVPGLARRDELRDLVAHLGGLLARTLAHLLAAARAAHADDRVLHRLLER